MAENVLKGFKVELASVFNQLSVEDKLNYLWFVRDDENATSGKIYLGSRLYSGEATTEDFNVLKERIENLVIKIDAVDTKVDAEDIKVNALDSKIDSVNEKIDVVKEECGVIYQKIDDIYDDSNRVREDVEEMKTQVSDAVNTVSKMEGKIDGEIARAEAAEAALQANIDDLNASKVSWLSKDDKRIVLENHKNLLGISTEGNTYNLAMVSKWDVADFGTTHLPLNLNSSEVPTVQLFGQTGEQAKHIAFAEDLTEKETSLQSKIDAEVSRAMEAESNLQTNINDTRNALTEVETNLQTNINDTRNALQIVESNLQTNINDTRNALELVESGLTQAIQQEAARAGEAEANLQTNINDTRNALQVVESGLTQAIQDMDAAYKQADKTLQANIDNVFNMVTVEGDERKAADKQINETLATVNTNLVESINSLNKNMVDGFNTINGGIDNEIRPELERVGKLADSAVQQVSLVQDAENSLHYELLVDNEKVGDINIPKDQFLKSVTYEQATHELVFLFEVASGETETRVDMSELVDAYKAGNGLSLADNTFSIVVDPSTQAYIEVSENGVKIVGVDEAIKVEENRAIAAEEALQGNIDAEVTRATEAEAALQASVDDLEANKVGWTSVPTEDMPNRKSILLENHDTLLGKALDGTAYNLAMVSKWDKCDFGTTKLEINLNGSAERPTYNDDKSLALVDDIKYYMSNKALDAVKIFGLTKESTSDDIKKALTYLGTSKVVSKDELELCFANGFGLRTLYGYIYVNWDGRGYVLCMNMPKYLNQSFSYNEISIVISETGEYSVFRKREDVLATQNSVNENSGSIVSLQSRLQSLEDKVSSLSKTNVESYAIDSATTESFNDSSVDYVISGDVDKSYSFSGKSVTVNNMNVSNDARLTINATGDVEVKNTVISGDFPKASGNAVVKVNNADYVVFKDMTFDATLYNTVEIGLSGSVLPKGVLFDNCKFLGKYTNNAISVFATQDNCVININNCEFQEVSNPLRLSNRTNVKCTVNITNCKFDKWESNPEYTGMILCQDYTSTAENVAANNLFGNGKITINIVNCTGPNGAITKPKNISTVCGSKDANQLLYVFLDNGGGNLAYDVNRYPTLNIN